MAIFFTVMKRMYGYAEESLPFITVGFSRQRQLFSALDYRVYSFAVGCQAGDEFEQVIGNSVLERHSGKYFCGGVPADNSVFIGHDKEN